MQKIVITLWSVFLLGSCTVNSQSNLDKFDSKDSLEVVSHNDVYKRLINAVDEKKASSDTRISGDKQDNSNFTKNNSRMKEATFGAGCFWCIEACFKDLEGVISVVPGYAGGAKSNPSYEDVCTGTTGHAEVARVIYDESKISYDELLEMFWFVHDPTQLNRQGNDIGTQYRSVIFYHDSEQKETAESYKKQLVENKVWDKPIVTEIVAINNYYEAEKYHHNYFEQNPQNSYCQAIVRPKVEKFKKVFSAKMK